MTSPNQTFRVLNGAGRAPVVLLCDHASHAVPPELGDLGLSQEQITRHIGWDIGAAALTEKLSQALDAPALLAGYSRLVADINRAPDDPTLICEISDGVLVPGNRNLSPAERQRRIDAYFTPYHAAVAAAIDAALQRSALPAILSIHSFTPSMKGRQRPWHAGILWNQDGRLALPLIQALREEPGLVVGDNEPYSGRSQAGFSIREHGERRGLPHVLVEVRQDLISDEAGVAEWAVRLERCFRRILAESGVAVLAA
ncbi:N-formylglutamate amidohydrolase [Ferrovibrio sp.]|uniref:N-formylglutamate amidohydrolase n=1 Tax=Ferrovibrio sp. TaxID=1917215 RepID=UPI001B65E166|nr:N-formylglutamate amidohydrolase [Ferrovibrio sp.]MBP7065315.1 N-formylglutamate amidohydrolase [Ferrovibrio sp.]